jgi:hypothetical protein
MVRQLQDLSPAARRAEYAKLIGKSQDEARAILSSTGATSRNAKILRENMEAAGKTFAPGDHAHHIVASTHPRAEPARRVLEKHGINVNAHNHGVGVAEDLHSGLHTNRYLDEVNALLLQADKRGKASVIATLAAIGRRIKSGKFP